MTICTLLTKIYKIQLSHNCITSTTSLKDSLKDMRSYILEELLCYNTSSGVDRQLHLTDLFVDLLHEVNDKVHQLVLVHLLCVEVGYEETDVITLDGKK